VIGQHEVMWWEPGQRQPFFAYRDPARRTVAQEPAQLVQPLRERVTGATRECGRSTRCNAALLTHAQVDPTRVRRCEGSELFCDHKRLVVGQ
jgi:hypothetical protein